MPTKKQVNQKLAIDLPAFQPIPPSLTVLKRRDVELKALAKLEEKLDDQFTSTIEVLQILGAVGDKW